MQFFETVPKPDKVGTYISSAVFLEPFLTHCASLGRYMFHNIETSWSGINLYILRLLKYDNYMQKYTHIHLCGVVVVQEKSEVYFPNLLWG